MAEQPPIYSQKDLLTLNEDTLAEYLQQIMEWFGASFHQLTPALALQYSSVGILVCNFLTKLEGDDSYQEIAEILESDTELIQVEAIRRSLAMLNAMRHPN